MVKVMVCVKSIPGGHCESLVYIDDSEKTSNEESGVASAIVTGLKMIFEEMAKVSEVSQQVELDDPSAELTRRLKARFSKED